MHTNSTQFSDYMKFYKYISVLTEEQIAKLRRIAIGIWDMSAFTDDEIQLLEVKLQLQQSGT